MGLACGAMGEKRLYYALNQFDKFLAQPLALAKAPANAIDEINIAIFGFSRGAALARAFVNLLMASRCVLHGQKWALKAGGWPVRVRFMGLFDTVASVGQPMSSNTTGFIEAVRGDVPGMISKRLKRYHDTRPEELAFFSHGAPGADPAPGNSAGHDDWGAKLKIHETVEEVRHFVAAHEIRNSFPLDSVSVSSSGRVAKPANFFETVYPGSHSDVGGSYAPGEGARALAPNENLGRIPLHHMYDYAMRQGVPLLPKTAWKPESKDDFDVSTQLIDDYNYYIKKLGLSGSLGVAINRNVELYLAWRFRNIKRKIAGDRSEAILIHSYDGKYRQEEAALNMDIETLKKKDTLALLHLDTLKKLKEEQASRFDATESDQKTALVSDSAIQNADNDYKMVHDEFLKLKARKDSLPDMKNLQAMSDLYDRQLLADARAVRDVSKKSVASNGGREIGNLRPHYKALLEAFENEFVKARGLNDERIIRFFDNYVHDSLAGFANDATLPSDPRVVYLGGDEKFRYASAEPQNSALEFETGIA